MKAISMSHRSELHAVIRTVIDPVRVGELDKAIEEVAEKSVSPVKLVKPGKN